MTMLESFFDCRRDSRDVFESLDVYKRHPEFCAEWMNQYPTLFITMKDVEGLSFESAYEMLQEEIAKLCIKYFYRREQFCLLLRNRQKIQPIFRIRTG